MPAMIDTTPGNKFLIFNAPLETDALMDPCPHPFLSELVKFKLERCQELRSMREVAADSEDK